MKDHQQRVRIERDQLNEKLEKLETFITTDNFKSLIQEERHLLERQQSAMQVYLDILDARIARFE